MPVGESGALADDGLRLTMWPQRMGGVVDGPDPRRSRWMGRSLTRAAGHKTRSSSFRTSGGSSAPGGSRPTARHSDQVRWSDMPLNVDMLVRRPAPPETVVFLYHELSPPHRAGGTASITVRRGEVERLRRPSRSTPQPRTDDAEGDGVEYSYVLRVLTQRSLRRDRAINPARSSKTDRCPPMVARREGSPLRNIWCAGGAVTIYGGASHQASASLWRELRDADRHRRSAFFRPVRSGRQRKWSVESRAMLREISI